ncbi:MAG TPA: phospho-N-acetylmuramoyl-pentapeptide-transferase [Planctomycetota bacterium]|nr:phospho-N-acetylmuramoyl-pentapeptide-transferase [Planctomycetota bacterium]
MLYLLFQLRYRVYGGFNLFQYITFRAAFAAITAFLIGWLLGPFVIRRLWKMGVIDKPENPDAPQLDVHVTKKKVPTMGGVLIVLSIVISTALWARPTQFIFLGILTVAWLGAVGLVDDYVKLRRHRHGLSKSQKLALQTFLGVVLAFILLYSMQDLTWGLKLAVPFFSKVHVWLPWFVFLALAVVVIVGSSNAVNLTDGMDGLATGCVVMAGIAFAVISYLTGHVGFSNYMKIAYIPGAGELSVFCAAIVGACLAFLWYNCHPAEVIMGDTGSLPLGGALGYVAVVTRQEIGLFIIGGIFVAEALSVMIQVFYYKRTKKRFFLMAPIHHHFQLKGLAETKVVVRFIIVAAILTAFAVATLKIR